MKTINGEWIFYCDFGFGTDQGVAILYSDQDRVTGILKFTETPEDMPCYKIEEEITGFFNGIQLNIKGISIKSGSEISEESYALDSYTGIMNSSGQIIGTSEDSEGTIGVFSLKRKVNAF